MIRYYSQNSIRLLGIVVMLSIIVVDFASKFYAMQLLINPPRGLVITSFFSLTPVWNHGVSFGMLKAGNQVGVWLLIFLALGISSVVGYYLFKATRRFQAVMYGLIIGGAVGNMIDRIRFGAVFDFLDFHMYTQHYPAFNIADSAICVGVLLIFLEQWCKKEKPHS